MEFWKVNSNGNDFIITFSHDSEQDFQSMAKKLCQRNYAVGADGIIVIEEDKKAFCAYFYNADGSRARMCGNGLLCIGEVLKRLKDVNEGIVNTYSGQSTISYEDDLVCVKMPPIKKGLPFPSNIGGIHFTTVDVGNAHAIARVRDVNCFDFLSFAKNISRIFDGNISLVSLANRSEFHIRTYERGVGETKSCGSAAVASYYALRSMKMVMRTAIAKSEGGNLYLAVNEDNRFVLKGTPKIIYRGETYEY